MILSCGQISLFCCSRRHS